MIRDIVSDMLTRIRNANLVRHQIVQIPKTKITLSIAKILKQEGYIKNFEELVQNNEKIILICLKYHGPKRQPILTSLIRISRPGLRIYVNSKNIPNILDNYGIAIISTSQGVITNQKAKSLGIGGEILCYIW
jgi:small subunit ribosomal protein S8